MEGTVDSTAATTPVGAVVIVLAVIFVALRVYVRIFTRAGLKWDDWLVLFAVASTVLTAVLLLWGNSFQLHYFMMKTNSNIKAAAIDPTGVAASENTDPSYVYTEADTLFLKLGFISSILYFTISGATKLGILLMYDRNFSSDAAFKRALYVATSLVLGWWIGCTVATLTNCIPLQFAWISSLPNSQYCFNYNMFWMASGVCDIFLDCVILALPVRVVLSLRLPKRKKATVAGVFLFGGL